MNRPKSHINPGITAALLAVCLVILSACSLNIDPKESETISQEDMEAVSQILGESLSDENAGIISSFYDAITDISNSGFVRTPAAREKKEGHDENTGRGSESELKYRYDADTGTHQLSFVRRVNTIGYNKQVNDTLRYVYLTPQGEFIEDLDLVNDQTSSIVYYASRKGEILTPARNSRFARQDTFLINGVEGASTALRIDGVHHGSGSFNGFTLTDSIHFERRYRLQVNFLNIRLAKSIIEQNISLEQGVSGILTYSLTIEDPTDASVSRTIDGSMELVGDGTATLRLNDVQRLFQINLDNGNVNDPQREFEGRIASVDVSASTFTLANGLTILVNENTRIDPESDLFTLQAVSAALEKTPFVRAEGIGSKNNGTFEAARLEFELDEDNDDGNDDLEFEERISSVDTLKNTFTLVSGIVIGVNESTRIDDEGDYLTLKEVADALVENTIIQADGEARYVEGDSLRYLATEVEFEQKEGDEEEEDKINFEGVVVSVDLSEQTLTLDTGAVIRITVQTELKGDFTDLNALESALSAGIKVEADGKGIEDTESTAVDLIALEIEFETED